MKKNIKKAETGQRIRGTSTNLPKGTGTAAAKMIMDSKVGKSKLTKAPKGLEKLIDDKYHNGFIVDIKKEASILGDYKIAPDYLGPSGEDYAKKAKEKYGSSRRPGPVRNNNQATSLSSSSAPAKTEEKKGGGGGGAKGTKGAGTSAGSSARKVTRTAAAKISAPKREMPSTELSRPSMSIQKGPEKREFTKTESKIAGELQKMKSGENTEASRAKIKALQDKRRAEKMKAERQKNRSNNKALRKSARAAKFNARQVKKSAK
jgi:Spy/CpxP family protein refolding chaperone